MPWGKTLSIIPGSDVAQVAVVLLTHDVFAAYGLEASGFHQVSKALPLEPFQRGYERTDLDHETKESDWV
jgi:hypothetical protein